MPLKDLMLSVQMKLDRLSTLFANIVAIYIFFKQLDVHSVFNDNVLVHLHLIPLLYTRFRLAYHFN